MRTRVLVATTTTLTSAANHVHRVAGTKPRMTSRAAPEGASAVLLIPDIHAASRHLPMFGNMISGDILLHVQM